MLRFQHTLRALLPGASLQGQRTGRQGQGAGSGPPVPRGLRVAFTLSRCYLGPSELCAGLAPRDGPLPSPSARGQAPSRPDAPFPD